MSELLNEETISYQDENSYQDEEWYTTLFSNKKFLYGEKVKYDFQKPRPTTYLDNAKLISRDEMGKATIMSKDTHFIIKGPYDLRNKEELNRVRHLHKVLSKLHQLEFLDENDCYNTADVVIESSSVPHNAWFLYEYGGSECVQTFYDRIHNDQIFNKPESNIYNKHYFARILISMMIKFVFGVKNPTCFKSLISPCDKIKLMGLDIIADNQSAENWFVPVKSFEKCWKYFVNSLKKCDDLCIEAMDLYDMRFKKAFGAESTEYENWIKSHQVILSTIFPNYGGETNVLKFGWPVKKGQRIMFKYLRELLPGTILSGSKGHVKLDYTCFAYKYRNVRPDDSCRKKLYFTEQHGDIKIEAEKVRPMTLEEQEEYPFIDNDLDFIRVNKNISYYPGDIVKIYNERVNEEDDCMGTIKKTQNMEKIKGRPDDIGIVLKSGNNNPYWKTVFCWKSKVIKDINCSCMYWLPDANGKLVHVKDFELRLEEESPLKILREYQGCFEKWI